MKMSVSYHFEPQKQKPKLPTCNLTLLEISWIKKPILDSSNVRDQKLRHINKNVKVKEIRKIEV